MSRARIELKKALAFAEMAEAIGITTRQILAANLEGDGKLVVVYSHPTEHSRDIYAVALSRGQDGILFMASQPRHLPGFLDQLDERMRLELPPEFWEWADREHPE